MAALVKAIEQSRFKQAKLLLELGDDINQQDVYHGITPLMMVCFIENETKACRVGRWLLKHGANPGIQDKNGISSLMHACGLGREKLVALFLTQTEDYDLNAADNEGNTALLYSVLQGNKRITEAVVNALKKYKIDGMDKANKRGETPLIKASQLGHFKCVEVLLKNGRASPNARDFEYKLTAKEWETRIHVSRKPERSNTWAPERRVSKSKDVTEVQRTFTENGRATGHPLLTSESMTKSSSLDHKNSVYISKTQKNKVRKQETTLGDDSSSDIDENCPELSETKNKIRFTLGNQFRSQEHEPNSKHYNETFRRRAKLYPNEKQFLSKRKENSPPDTGNSKTALTIGVEKYSKSVGELSLSREPSPQRSYLKISKHTLQNGEYRSKSAPEQVPKTLPMPLGCRGRSMPSRSSFRKGKSRERASRMSHSEPEAEIEVMENGVTSSYGKIPERCVWSGVNQHQSTLTELSKLMEILGEQTSPSFRPAVKPLPRLQEISDSDIEENVSEKEKRPSSKRAMRLWQVSKVAVSMVTLNRHAKLYSKNEFSSLQEQNYERFLQYQSKFDQLTADQNITEVRARRRQARRMSESAILRTNPKLSESLSMSFPKPKRKLSVTESNSSSSSHSSSQANDSKNLAVASNLVDQSMRNDGKSPRGKLIRQANFSQSLPESSEASSISSATLNRSWSASALSEGGKSLPVVKEEPQIYSFPPIHDEE